MKEDFENLPSLNGLDDSQFFNLIPLVLERLCLFV